MKCLRNQLCSFKQVVKNKKKVLNFVVLCYNADTAHAQSGASEKYLCDVLLLEKLPAYNWPVYLKAYIT